MSNYYDYMIPPEAWLAWLELKMVKIKKTLNLFH